MLPSKMVARISRFLVMFKFLCLSYKDSAGQRGAEVFFDPVFLDLDLVVASSSESELEAELSSEEGACDGAIEFVSANSARSSSASNSHTSDLFIRFKR